MKSEKKVLSEIIDDILVSEQYIKSQVHRLKRGTKARRKKDADLKSVRWLKKKKLKEYIDENRDPEIKP